MFGNGSRSTHKGLRTSLSATIPKYGTNSGDAAKRRILEAILRNPSGAGRTNGACVQINGEWSSGKSLFLCFITQERNHSEGIPIISNLTLRNVHPYYQITDNIDILGKARGCLIAIDEIRRYMDSYLTHSKQARFISNVTADFGKYSNDFYYSDQDETAAPKRVRNNISMVVYPKLDESTNWVQVYLFQGITEYIFVEPYFYFAFYAPDYWGNYDTAQKIEDFILRFPTLKYAIKFMKWKREHKISKVTNRTLKLWNLDSGIGLGAGEIDAVYTLLEEKGYV